ncbi:MAG: hypothetical protein GKR77_03570 [Legionellales bacterium]|nr:hypothetical protein [Legionellales bacterium]
MPSKSQDTSTSYPSFDLSRLAALKNNIECNLRQKDAKHCVHLLDEVISNMVAIDAISAFVNHPNAPDDSKSCTIPNVIIELEKLLAGLNSLVTSSIGAVLTAKTSLHAAISTLHKYQRQVMVREINRLLLFDAIRIGSVKHISEVINQFDTDPLSPEQKDEQNTADVKEVIEDLHNIFNRPNDDGHTPLTAAINAVINAEEQDRDKHLQVLTGLVKSIYRTIVDNLKSDDSESYLRQDIRDQLNEAQQILLFNAIRIGNPDSIDAIIEQVYNLDQSLLVEVEDEIIEQVYDLDQSLPAQDENEKRPAHVEDMEEDLSTIFNNVNKDTGYTPLTAAVTAIINAEEQDRDEHFNMLIKLVECPYTDFMQPDGNGNTVLKLAAEARTADTKQLFNSATTKEYSEFKDAPDGNGNTTLKLAAEARTADTKQLFNSATTKEYSEFKDAKDEGLNSVSLYASSELKSALLGAGIASIITGIIVTATLTTFTFPAACIIIGAMLLGAVLGIELTHYKFHFNPKSALISLNSFVEDEPNEDQSSDDFFAVKTLG